MQFIKKHSSIIRNIYTSLYASLASLIFSRLFFNATWRFTRESAIRFEKTHQRVFFNCFALAISLFAVIMIYYYFDNLDLYNKRDYLKDKTEKILLSKPEYLIGFAISLLFATSMLTEPIHNLLSMLGNVNAVWARLLSIVTVSVMRLVQINNLGAKWYDEIHHPLFVEKPIFKGSQDIDNFKPAYLVLKPIGFIAIFTLCYLFSAKYLIEIIYSLYVILTSLWQGLLLIALIPFVIFFSIRIGVQIKSRRKLIKKLRSLKKGKYATVRYSGAKYLSAIFYRLPFSVEVTAQSGETFLCNVVCSGRVNAPMYFSTDKYYTEHGFHLRGGGLLSQMGASPFAAVVDIGKWGDKSNPTNLVAGYRRQHDINFPEKEGNRALLVNPAPTACFSLYENIANPIDTGEDMGNYTIYSATGFCNTVERLASRDRFEK